MGFRGRLRARWRRATGPRGRDISVVVLSALYTAGVTAGALLDHKPGAAMVVAGCGIAGTVLLWWRHRWPIAVTLIAGVLDVVGAAGLALGLALMTVAVRRRDRKLVLLTLYTAACLSAPIPFNGDAFDLSNVIAGTVGALVWALLGAYVGARRALVESLRDRAERAENERELRAEQARSAERARIAREMHDVLAHKVSLIALHAGALEVNPDRGPAAVEAAAAQIRATARETLEDLRGVLGVLRGGQDGAPLAPQPSLADVATLVEQSRVAGVQVELRIEVAVPPGATRWGRTAYRIVQEGLTNVHKHARGAWTEVVIAPTGEPGVIEVSVTNRPPVAAGTLLPGSGAGLVGLRERIELGGGTLATGPTPDGGWRIAARLPIGEGGTDRITPAAPPVPADPLRPEAVMSKEPVR